MGIVLVLGSPFYGNMGYQVSKGGIQKLLGVLSLWHPKILADQLTPYKPGGQIMPT